MPMGISSLWTSRRLKSLKIVMPKRWSSAFSGVTLRPDLPMTYPISSS